MLIKRVIILLVPCMVLLTSAAFATNWFYVCRTSFADNTSAPGPVSSYYVDKNTVVKNGDKVTFWVKMVFDEEYMKNKTIYYKYEATLARPRQGRSLELYSYDAKGNENYNSHTPGTPFTPVIPLNNVLIDAIQDVNDGTDNGSKPW